MNTAAEVLNLYTTIICRIYKNSVPLGGVLIEELSDIESILLEEMISEGLLSTTTRLNGSTIISVTKKAVMLIPPKEWLILHLDTDLQWRKTKNDSNVRPLYHGPFHCRVK